MAGDSHAADGQSVRRSPDPATDGLTDSSGRMPAYSGRTVMKEYRSDRKGLRSHDTALFMFGVVCYIDSLAPGWRQNEWRGVSA